MGKDLKGKELGSGLYQRKNGIYCGRFVDRFGKRRTVYDESLRCLKAKIKEEIKEDNILSTKLSTDGVKTTLDEWYKKWMDIYKDSIRENSKRHYAQVYNKHISPVIGSKYLTDITDSDITALINDLKKRGYMYETRNKCKVILVDMFNRAMLNKLVLYNPAKSVRVLRDRVQERRVLSKDEQTDFFDTCKGTFYDELFTVAVLTGLRPGELCALRWSDIDLSRNCLSVTRTLVYQKLGGDEKKEFHIDPPKTKESERIVYFGERCAIALKKQFSKRSVISLRDAYSPLPGFEDLLFVTKYGTPINASIFGSAIDRIVDLINENRCDGIDNFERFSAHCFRHTYATRCFEAGVEPKIVQKQLGHATLKMTLDLYTHISETKRSDELNKFIQMSEEVFEGSDDVAKRRFIESKKIVQIG